MNKNILIVICLVILTMIFLVGCATTVENSATEKVETENGELVSSEGIEESSIEQQQEEDKEVEEIETEEKGKGCAELISDFIPFYNDMNEKLIYNPLDWYAEGGASYEGEEKLNSKKSKVLENINVYQSGLQKYLTKLENCELEDVSYFKEEIQNVYSDFVPLYLEKRDLYVQKIQTVLEATNQYENAINSGDYSKGFGDFLDISYFKEKGREINNKIDNLIKIGNI